MFQRLADSGHIRRRDLLLDYGCDKGRVAFFMASVVGCRVTGIDHSRKLIDLAKENRRTSRLGDRITLIQSPAELYEVGDENVFFFFNPFSEKVFDCVLRRLPSLSGMEREPTAFIETAYCRPLQSNS